jgi:hypothetical protein
MVVTSFSNTVVQATLSKTSWKARPTNSRQA